MGDISTNVESSFRKIEVINMMPMIQAIGETFAANYEDLISFFHDWIHNYKDHSDGMIPTD